MSLGSSLFLMLICRMIYRKNIRPILKKPTLSLKNRRKTRKLLKLKKIDLPKSGTIKKFKRKRKNRLKLS